MLELEEVMRKEEERLRVLELRKEEERLRVLELEEVRRRKEEERLRLQKEQEAAKRKEELCNGQQVEDAESATANNR